MSGRVLKVPDEMYRALAEFIERQPGRGFASPSSVAQAAIRQFLERHDPALLFNPDMDLAKREELAALVRAWQTAHDR